MGSPSSILTMGLGSWGSVNEVITLGYGSSGEVDYPAATDVRFGVTFGPPMPEAGDVRFGVVY
jgi:hypothetical protein